MVGRWWGARTDLSGLTAAEARALFLVAGPGAATPEVKAALRKLVRALPETFRASAEAAGGAVVIDASDWDRPPVAPPPHLAALEQAVVDGVQVGLHYEGRDREPGERIVHPLGLVAKRQVWYLIADTEAGMRTFRVSRVRAVVRTDQPVVRPPGFDLSSAWQSVLATLDERRIPCRVTALADPGIVNVLRGMLGTRLSVGDATEDGRMTVEVRGHSAEIVAAELAGWADHLEVTAPDAVRGTRASGRPPHRSLPSRPRAAACTDHAARRLTYRCVSPRRHARRGWWPPGAVRPRPRGSDPGPVGSG